MNNTMNYQIYSMYVNGRDLLAHSVQSIDHHAEKMVIIDNSLDQNLVLEGFPGEIYKPSVPLFCSQSYNLICRMAQQRQQDVFFIMHSDAEASNEIIVQLLDIAAELNQNQVKWGVLFTAYDVLCLCNTQVLKDFLWDIYLPVYYTDVDYYHRLRLAGVEIIETNLPVKHMNGGSSTMKADVALSHFIQCNFPAWAEYYRRKWGGERGQEQFTTPFHQMALSVPGNNENTAIVVELLPGRVREESKIEETISYPKTPFCHASQYRTPTAESSPNVEIYGE